MDRKRLIFFAATDPAEGGRAAWSAYHFGLVAHRAGLPAEVRLAGSAVAVLHEGREASGAAAADDRSLHHGTRCHYPLRPPVD